MKYVYHGSSIPNLKIIKTNESTHMKKWVYACVSKAISTIFLSPLGNDLYYSLSGDGIDYPVELVERKSDMFKKIFNCSGYIYKLDASNFKCGQTGWTAEVVSEKDEEVLEVEYIENVYDELIKLNKEGLIRLYLYPEKPNRIPQDNSDLIPKVIKWKKNGFDVNKFYELYPELKDKFLKMLNEQ
ncbi:MAG: hypothetical protein ACI4U4_05805 [Bacilli bacterium]